MDFICFTNIFFRFGKKLLESMLAPYEMNMQELIVLRVIHESPGIYQSKLINFTGLDKGNFSKLLKKLESNKFIYRLESTNLTGQNQCFLTDDGKAFAPKLFEVLYQWEDAITDDIGEEDLVQFNNTALRISNNLFNQLEIKW